MRSRLAEIHSLTRLKHVLARLGHVARQVNILSTIVMSKPQNNLLLFTTILLLFLQRLAAAGNAAAVVHFVLNLAADDLFQQVLDADHPDNHVVFFHW